MYIFDFFSKKKNHSAATGRFATYQEIADNFYNCPPLKEKISVLKILTGIFFLIFFIISLSSFFYLQERLTSDIAVQFNIFSAIISVIFLIAILFLFLPYFFNKKNIKKAGFRNFFKLGMLSKTIIGIDRNKRFEHCMIISPTGGGKTSKYIIPGIKNDASYSNTSVFAIDIDSPYLYTNVKHEWLKRGKTAINFDPYFENTAHFNPLVNKYNEIISNEKLYELSSALFHPDADNIKTGDMHAYRYYARRASDVFYACLLYLKYKYGVKYFNLSTVFRFLKKGAKFIEKEVSSYNGLNDKLIKEGFNNLFELPVYERAKVITDIINELSFLRNETTSNAFKTSDKKDSNFTLGDIFERDTLLIAGIPKEKLGAGGAKMMSFLTDMVIKEIYEHRRKRLKNADAALDAAGNNNNDNNNKITGNYVKDKDINGNLYDAGIKNDLYNEASVKEDTDIYLYLDEFPALTLNNFDVELANLRKTKTGVLITVQDISFLEEKYGNASLIDSNIGTHIIMGHASNDTCETYSKKMGNKYVLHKEKMNTANHEGIFPGNVTMHETPVSSGLYPLMNPDEIKNMDTDKVLIFTKFTNPFILNI